MAWTDISLSDFIVKGHRFDVFSFLENGELADRFKKGSLFVIRLAPDDYHRFHFPVSGTLSDPIRIEGDYYSVNPMAIREIVEIFCLNKREYVVLNSDHFGKMIICEIGATMVGSIIQTYQGKHA